MSRTRLLACSLVVVLLAGCSGGGAGEGLKSYDDKEARVRFSYPQDWTVKRDTLGKSPEGEYVIYRLTQPTQAAPKGSSLQLVPDPEHFTPEQIYANKWRSVAGSATVSTRTIDVAGRKGVAIESSRETTGGQVRTYEAIAAVGNDRIAVLSFETTDAASWSRTAPSLDPIMRSLAPY